MEHDRHTSSLCIFVIITKMYYNAREYVNSRILRPVLIRAGSVKQIGSHAASAAVDRLDGALTVADKYVDRYLPGDPMEKVIDGKLFFSY